MGNEPQKIALTPRFLHALGLFHAMHSTFDLTVDYAIFKMLGITAQQAHAITSGMMFGKKARLLCDLLKRSEHPKKQTLIRTLEAVRGAKRDVIAHGYIWSDDKFVKFIERPQGGEGLSKEHKFTLDEFAKHAERYFIHTTEFFVTFVESPEDVEAFAYAAFSLSRKSSTSAEPPKSTMS